MSHWTAHPAVRTGSDLTIGERASDRLKRAMGTWSILGAVTAVILLWLAFVRDPGELHLNLGLSCMAAVQGIVLQIAANRGDRIASELAHHDFEADSASRQMLETLGTNFAALQAQHAEQGQQLARALRMLEAIVPKATGGPVHGGQQYIVGSGDRELFVPEPGGDPDAD